MVTVSGTQLYTLTSHSPLSVLNVMTFAYKSTYTVTGYTFCCKEYLESDKSRATVMEIRKDNRQMCASLNSAFMLVYNAPCLFELKLRYWVSVKPPASPDAS